jgi:hypothetical protein
LEFEKENVCFFSFGNIKLLSQNSEFQLNNFNNLNLCKMPPSMTELIPNKMSECHENMLLESKNSQDTSITSNNDNLLRFYSEKQCIELEKKLLQKKRIPQKSQNIPLDPKKRSVKNNKFVYVHTVPENNENEVNINLIFLEI